MTNRFTSLLQGLADPSALTTQFSDAATLPRLRVNAHVHLPPNFSAFQTAEQALSLTDAQGVAVLGASNYYDYSIYNGFGEQAASTEHLSSLRPGDHLADRRSGTGRRQNQRSRQSRQDVSLRQRHHTVRSDDAEGERICCKSSGTTTPSGMARHDRAARRSLRRRPGLETGLDADAVKRRHRRAARQRPSDRLFAGAACRSGVSRGAF